jgi:acetoin utilization protein AcuB
MPDERRPAAMGFPYKRILCPADFDENSVIALKEAAELARQGDGTVYVLHVVPMIIQPTGMPVYVDLYKSQEEAAWTQLRNLARKHLATVKYELLVQMGDPAGTILRAERRLSPDLVVMATHGRKGFSRFFLGSVAEMVVRESNCPVLTVRPGVTNKALVGAWMTANPVTASPGEKLSSVEAKMRDGGFRTIPVLKDGQLVGIITDRDIRQHVGYLDHTEVEKAMSETLITVTPSTSIREAARLLRERKIGGLPVVEDGNLVGILTTTDVLEAFTEAEEG